MSPLTKRRAQQQEGEVAVVWDSTRLLARELQADGFQTVMAGNVPNLELLTEEKNIYLLTRN